MGVVVTVSRTQLIFLAIAVIGILVIGFAAGRGCAPSPVVIPATIVQGIDAGPGEARIDQQLDAAVQMQEAQMQQIEHKFDQDIATFDDQQRQQYQQLRGSSLEDAAAFLSQWSRDHRDAGPPSK